MTSTATFDTPDGDLAEEYADALSAIAALETALAGRTATNNTPDGRLLLTLAWLRQEIAAQRLPIPVDRSYVSTVYYLVGSGEVDHIPGVKQPLGELYVVLKGFGLVKERHRAGLIALIDGLLADTDRCDAVTSAEAAALTEFRDIAGILRAGNWPAWRGPADYPFSGVDSDGLEASIPDFFERYSEIEDAVFERIRPSPLRKPPLPAPVPGLPPVAPSLPDALAGDLP